MVSGCKQLHSHLTFEEKTWSFKSWTPTRRIDGNFDDEEEHSLDSQRGLRRRPRSEQAELEQEIARDEVTVENYLTDWDPELSRMKPYRILESGEDAEVVRNFSC